MRVPPTDELSPHLLNIRMCPLVSVINKDPYEFYSLKSKANIGKLFASLSPRGAPCGSAPSVRVSEEGGSQRGRQKVASW